MIPTLKDIVELMASSNVWFFGVGAVVLTAMFAVKIVFKGIRWLVLIAVFGIIIFLLYGSLFRITIDSVPEELGDTEQVQKSTSSAYEYLQTNVLRGGLGN